MKYNINDIISATINNGGVVDTAPYHLNIVGIRDISSVDKFNDTLIYYYHDKDGKIIATEVSGFSTDPGLPNLVKPVNVKGCAILVEGWHDKLWMKGLHRGKYPALVQYSSTRVYRDNDKDTVLELDPATIDSGKFGINFHRASQWRVEPVVGLYSAGCQVVQNPNEFNKFMNAVDTAIKNGQQYFSYMLLDKSRV